MNETLKTLLERRSIRRYLPQQVDHVTLDQILQAGMYAPSAKGRQSATLVVVQEEKTLQELKELNAEVMGKPGTDPFYGAPTVVVVLADPSATNETNALFDGALVMGNLMNAAAALNVGSCWINRAKEMFERPEGKELLKSWGLPETLVGIGNCILGYAKDQPMPAATRKDGFIVHV